MPEELAELVVKIGADLSELKEALIETQKQTKKVAKALSLTGLAARAAMLKIANSSVIASMLMGQFNAMIGVVADTILIQLMPVIQPIMDFMWELTNSFQGLDESSKIAVAAIFAVSAALYILYAHPIVFAIAALIVAFVQLRKAGLGNVEAFLMVIGPLGQIILLVWKLIEALTGRSLVPDLERLANVLKVLVMPQLAIFKGALEGIQMLVSGLSAMAGTMVTGFTVAGTQITQSFTQVFNFLGSGLTEFKDKAKDALGGIGSKIKSGLGF